MNGMNKSFYDYVHSYEFSYSAGETRHNFATIEIGLTSICVRIEFFIRFRMIFLIIIIY